MKLQPRERRVRPDYLLDNAAALNLGHLFLGWGRKKRSSRSSAKKAAPKKEKASAKPAKKEAKKEVKKPAAQKAAPKPAAAKAKSPPRAATPTAAAQKAPKPAAKRPGRPAKRVFPGTVKKLPSTPLPAARPQPPKQVPKRAAPPRAAAAPATKQVVQRRQRRAALPPVIPNPVPTPELPAFSQGQAAANEDMLTITVRTMNGSSFRLLLTADTLLFELKRQILSMITPGPTSPNTIPRLPMLVMSGRPLMPDNATLRSLRFTTFSTVFCFPEPN